MNELNIHVAFWDGPELEFLVERVGDEEGE